MVETARLELALPLVSGGSNPPKPKFRVAENYLNSVLVFLSGSLGKHLTARSMNNTDKITAKSLTKAKNFILLVNYPTISLPHLAPK